MSGGFYTKEGTLDVKTLSNDKDVLARMTCAFILGCNSRYGEANGAARNT